MRELSSKRRRTARRKALPPLAYGDKDRLRRKIHAADPNCHWCTRPVRLVTQNRWSTAPSDMATLEHIIPECQGGHGESNMVLACSRCNNLRGIYPTLDQALLAYIEAGKTRLFDLISAPPFPFQGPAIRKARWRLREHLTLLANICA